jgi:O-antigen/teichoic acid export membrane protein
MVGQRDGDEVDLLASSVRTASGAIVSTTLYVLSGLVYALVTSPGATGLYFFLTLTIALVLRPIRGIGQALQKVGSERGESVGAYLGLTVAFTTGYLLLVGAVLSSTVDPLTRLTMLTPTLLGPAALFAVSTALVMIVDRLVAAAGYPSVGTWLTSLTSVLKLGLLLAFDPFVATAADIMLVVVLVRVAVYGLAAVGLGVVPARPGRHELDRALAFAKWSVPDQVLDRFAYNMPVYVLGIVATPVAVGVYETADRFADFGATIVWHLSTPLLTKVSGDTAVDRDVAAYVDAAATGGTGVTVLTFGYLLATHDLIAATAFASTADVFSITVLLVGGVNVFRGFWTLLSHVIEGRGYPNVSFRTKVYGLVAGVPVTAVLGGEFGAVAGAAGYAAMNVVVCVYVTLAARRLLESSVVDGPLALACVLGLFVTVLGTTAFTTVATQLGVAPLAAAAAAVPVSIVCFGATVWLASRRARTALAVTYVRVASHV